MAERRGAASTWWTMSTWSTLSTAHAHTLSPRSGNSPPWTLWTIDKPVVHMVHTGAWPVNLVDIVDH